jgi:hypothetical protein
MLSFLNHVWLETNKKAADLYPSSYATLFAQPHLVDLPTNVFCSRSTHTMRSAAAHLG